MSGKKFTYNPPAAKPKRPSAERVVSERGRKELPPGTKGGENLKPDRHYEHKQHAFDSYCKRSIKNEAMNAYTQLRKRSRREVSLSELPEDAMAQLAVYDCYSWEYTTFPVGGTVILIEDDRLAEALLALPQEDRPIGRWGRMHREYLREHRPAFFSELCLSGRLHTYLADLNEQAQERCSLIIRQMAEAEGVTEHMKAADQLLWVRSMNSIRNRAEEIVIAELIFLQE